MKNQLDIPKKDGSSDYEGSYEMEKWLIEQKNLYSENAQQRRDRLHTYAAGKTVISHNKISPEKRYQMIARAAYQLAEMRGFLDGEDGNPIKDWVTAETQIDKIFKKFEQIELKPHSDITLRGHE